MSLIQRSEADAALQVLVFGSADADYFISHVDLARISEYRQEAAKLTGEPWIGLLFRYLSQSRLVTITRIEGRVRGAGSESVRLRRRSCRALRLDQSSAAENGAS